MKSISEMTQKTTKSTTNTITDDGCMRLAAAIVDDVVEDYIKSVECYKKAKEYKHESMIKQYEYHLKSLRDFLRSDYCAGLVFLATGAEYNLNGDELLNIIDKRCQ